MTTNVKPSQLNYDKYTTDQYDKDIVSAIPHHREIHELIIEFLKSKYQKNNQYRILDLGVGTGITSKMIQDTLPKSILDVVDFSKQMLDGARKKLGTKNVKYIKGDYSKMKFTEKYDIAVTVIGLHHQNNAGKKKMFKKIYSLLEPKGVFIFGDLVTYKDDRNAALQNAYHYKHLVDQTTDEETLKEWAHHHMFLNDLAPVEDQIKWLREIGFRVSKKFLCKNTALLICSK